MPSRPPTEHRKFTRVPPRIKARLLADGGIPTPCTVKNISMNGVLLDCRSPLAEGSDCTVALQLSDNDTLLRIDARGVIRRSDEHGTAVEFGELDVDSFDRLRHLVLYNAADPERVEKEFTRRTGIK